MTESYQVPSKPWQTELEIKGSKFLTFAAQAATRTHANAFIRDLREKHPQANHVCWAYIAGSPDSTVRSMSDDGEPSGTAGMPMLKVLEYSGYGDIVVAVVRYFGGTKLGTGGLQRAYSEAVSMVLAELPVIEKVSRNPLQLQYDYQYEGHVSRTLNDFDVEHVQTDFGQQVSRKIAVASHEVDTLEAKLINITAGSIALLKLK